jgi:hypothetical protein
LAADMKQRFVSAIATRYGDRLRSFAEASAQFHYP